MATKTFNARFQFKGDTLANWTAANPVLKDRELAIVVVPAEAGAVAQEPAVLFKVGDGTTAFNSLAYVSAKAADVYDWAKAATKPSYSASEIADLPADTDTQYKLEQDNTDGHVLKLYSKGKNDTEWTEIKSITIPDTDTQYTLEKLTTASSGASASYVLKSGGQQVGATIDIPKDMVVSSGAVVTKTEAGAWGAAGTYIELTIANATSDKLYINVANLIEYVTSGSNVGDMVVVAVSDNHQVTATITDGTITKAKLHKDVQDSLGKADSAIQSGDLAAVATSGNVNDLSQTVGDVIILDCGSATTVI